MARITIERACGHKETINVIGPQRRRDSAISSAENRLCEECWLAEKKASNSIESERAIERSEELGLPPLEGSQKQVDWALRIRDQFCSHVEQETNAVLVRILNHAKEDVDTNAVPRERRDAVREAMECLLWEWIGRQTKSSWWIDYRSDLNWHAAEALCKPFWNIARNAINGNDALREEQERVQREIFEEKERVRLSQELAAEQTVYPEVKLSRNIAIIKLHDSSVTCDLPEKNDNLRMICKSLGYEWDPAAMLWRLNINDGGNWLVETGHRLLLSGIPVRIEDAELRRRAVAGEYVPNNPRRIRTTTGSPTAFSIGWPKTQDFYGAAKKIRGAKWNGKRMICPAESFDDVVGFAEVYKFFITPSAASLVEEQRQIREASLVVKVPPPPAPVMEPTGRPNLPDSEPEIPDHLLDEPR